jgi:hypothetical protein
MKDPATQSDAADVFARLVQDDEPLQDLLCKVDTLPTLSNYFGEKVAAVEQHAASDCTLRERGMGALAAFMSKCGRARMEVMMMPTLMSEIKQALDSKDSSARLAAAQCVLSLSRSVMVLRTKLVSAPYS